MLIRASDNEKVHTYIKRVTKKSDLFRCNKKNKWYVSWSTLFKNYTIFKLCVEKDESIQALIALNDVEDFRAVEISWMCVAPHNNLNYAKTKKYCEIGGHLFAHAARFSESLGYEGYFFGEAKNFKLLEHYVKKYHAWSIPQSGHPYHFVIDENAANNLMEVYDYEWEKDEK